MNVKKIIILYLFLFIPITIWGYETEWQDKRLGLTEFKLHGYFWFGYENNDAQSSKVDTGTKQGFTINRAYVRIDGKVKEGDFKNWKYHITIDGMPGSNEFLKYAFFGIPLPGDLTLIGGLQNNPTSTAGKYSLENLWTHRYLDEDGKAMWDQLGIAPSSDLGIGLEQLKDFYNFNIQIGNGEGYKKTSNAQTINNTTLESLAKGSGDSYGYHLYGRFTLTPLGHKDDIPTRIFLNVPFVLRNFYNIQRTETEYVNKLDFTTGQFEILKGESKAKRDYAYGIELDGLFNIGDMKLGLGVGQIIDKDIRRPSYKIDHTLISTGITISNFYNYYYPAATSIGIANYIFAYVHNNKIGVVARYYEHTDDATLAGTLKHKEGLSLAEQILKLDAANGNIGDIAPETVIQNIRSGTIDEGKSKMKTFVFAIEYYLNKSYKFAVGIKQATTTNKNGTPYKITPFQANNIKSTGYTTNNFASYVSSMAGITPNPFTDADLVGTKRIEKQIFFRSQFTY